LRPKGAGKDSKQKLNEMPPHSDGAEGGQQQKVLTMAEVQPLPVFIQTKVL